MADEQAPVKKSFFQKLVNKLLEFDIYSQPLNLTYKKRAHFKTGYGIFFSLITFGMCIVIIVDSLVFHKPKNTCQFKDIDDTVVDNYQINLNSELFMFYAVFDKEKNQYINPTQKNMFTAKLRMFSYDIVDNYLTKSPVQSKDYKFDVCSQGPGEESSLDPNFLSTFKMPIFCATDQTLEFSNVNVYMTKLEFLLENNIDDAVLYKAYFPSLILELYLPSYTYNYESGNFKVGYKKYSLNFNEFAFGPNVFEASLTRDAFIFYNGYFNIKDVYTFYSTTGWSYDKTSTDNSNRKMLSVRLNLPFEGTVNYYQTFSILSSLGNVSGWFYLLTMVLGFIVGKCSRYKLYESVANDAFSLITPEGMKKIEESSKDIKEKIGADRANILELVVEDATKYTMNDQLHFGPVGTFLYLFCCDCFKSKNTKAKEQTVSKALSELYKTIDLINIVNTCQEIRLLKEIIFEPYQKKLFENLIQPIITAEEIKCAYEISYLETKAQTEAEKDAMSKANLKDSLIQLSSNEYYSEIDFKLINLLNILPDFKHLFFKLEEKTENIKSKFFSLSKNPNIAKKEQIIKNFEKFLKQVTQSIEEYKYINSSLIQETNDIMKSYKSVFEENKMLKEVLYGDILMGNGHSIEDMKGSNTLVSYHPIILPKEKNSEQLESARGISRIKKRRGIFYILETMGEFIFLVIDSIFCLRSRNSLLKREYNLAVQQSFMSMQHCLRISFLSFMVFLVFNIKSLFNNSLQDCNFSILCYGFLSFPREPSDVAATFSFSIMFYMLVLFVYNLNLLVKYFLTRQGNNYLSKRFHFSKFLFSTPSLKVITQEDSKGLLNNVLMHYAAIDKFKNQGNFTMGIINTIVFCINFFGIVGHVFITLEIIKTFKNWGSSYGLRILLVNICLSATLNIVPMVHYFLVKFHKNLKPNTIHFFQFWFPYTSRLLCYVLYLTSNFDIFLGKSGEGDFYEKYAYPYQKDLFVCREDQAAFNMIIFVLIEFFLRKLFLLFSSVYTIKNKTIYLVEWAIIDTMCNFLIFSCVTLVFPIMGVITFLVFFLDYQIEYIIIRTCRKKPHSHNSDTVRKRRKLLFIFFFNF
jgi:hypothetical protein